MIKKISIYGLGNFGYAILKHFDNKSNEGISIHAYDRNKKLTNFLKKNLKHPYLHKTVKISHKIIFEDTVEGLLSNCDVLILAVNSDATREVIRKISNFVDENLIIVNTAKALDYKTGKRLSEIIQKGVPNKKFKYALLAGGTIAKDLFNHEPLGADIACENKRTLPILIKTFHADNLTVYPSTDLTGVEYASAFKNIIAIMAGIINGMNFSYGSETHMISRCAYEIQQIILARGGKPRTFNMNSQSWSNDLWMSCTGNSRNREFGTLLGKGISVNKAMAMMQRQKKTIEGINTLKGLKTNSKIRNYPLMNFLYRFIILKSSNLNELKQLIFSQQY